MSMPHTAAPPYSPPARDTHAYKVAADGHAIEADIIGAQPGAAKPCVVWIHGGGLIFGSRKTSPRPPFLRALLERGFVVVSISRHPGKPSRARITGRWTW